MDERRIERFVVAKLSRTCVLRGRVDGTGDAVRYRFSKVEGGIEVPDYLHLVIREGDYHLVEWPMREISRVISSGRALGTLVTLSEVQERLDVISSIGEARMGACSFDVVGAIGGAAIDFMTHEERAERHFLTMLLPTAAQEREEARDRIAQRVAARRAKRARRQ